jgi:hypothetical protein
MNRKFIFYMIFLIILSGCAIIEGESPPGSSAVPGKSEKRCGDGVCDGPENADTCPEDCALPSTASSDEGTEPGIPSDADDVLAQLFIDVQITREGGAGSCGQSPWGVDHIDGGDFSCQPPKYWYNYDLSATALQNLWVVPSGNENWMIIGEKAGGGTYQSMSASSDGQRICAPVSIVGNIFEFNAEGNYRNGEIAFAFKANPAEVAIWECDKGQGYERETTLLLIDWAVAMTGNYTDLSVLLNEENWVSPGVYQKIITASANPSPDNRDRVNITIDFKCVEEDAEGIYNSVQCPWE